jgi:hypothetical protein
MSSPEIALSPNKKTNGYDKYQIEDAARTLSRAREIQADKKLFPLALTELKRQQKAINTTVKEVSKNTTVDGIVKSLTGKRRK